jgi:hypothetical protein
MAWNLAYDHLLNWILKEPSRLAAFNAQIIVRIGAKRGTGLIIAKREDFASHRRRPPPSRSHSGAPGAGTGHMPAASGATAQLSRRDFR